MALDELTPKNGTPWGMKVRAPVYYKGSAAGAAPATGLTPLAPAKRASNARAAARLALDMVFLSGQPGQGFGACAAQLGAGAAAETPRCRCIATAPLAGWREVGPPANGSAHCDGRRSNPPSVTCGWNSDSKPGRRRVTPRRRPPRPPSTPVRPRASPPTHAMP